MTSRVTQLELRGSAADLPDYSYPPDVWTYVENIDFARGHASRARGYERTRGTPNFTPQWLQMVNRADTGGIAWVYGGNTAIGKEEAGVHTTITGSLVIDNTDIHNPWTGGVLNGHAVLGAKGTLTPAYWRPGMPTALALPGWPTGYRAQSVRVFREYLIAMNIEDTVAAETREDQILWSDAAPPGDVPQNWTASLTSQAGDAQASFAPGFILDGATLRDRFMVYKQHSVYVLQLVGGRFVMTTRPVFSTFGALSQNCVVEWRGNHFVLADGDVIVHNGNEARSILEDSYRREIFDGIDGDFWRCSFLALDAERQELWVCTPRAGEPLPTTAYVFSIEKGVRGNAWGRRDMPASGIAHIATGVIADAAAASTWDTRGTTWDTDPSRWSDLISSPVAQGLLMADAATLLQGVGLASDYDGSSPTAVLRREGLDFGAPDVYKFVKRLWPRVNGAQGETMEIRGGTRKTADGTTTWGPYKTYTIGIDESVLLNLRGRYLSFEFRSTAATPWESPSFDVELIEAGRF